MPIHISPPPPSTPPPQTPPQPHNNNTAAKQHSSSPTTTTTTSTSTSTSTSSFSSSSAFPSSPSPSPSLSAPLYPSNLLTSNEPHLLPALTSLSIQQTKTTNQLPNTTTVEHLPNELLYQIMLFVRAKRDLASCLLVCRRWLHHTVTILWNRPAPSSINGLLRMLRTFRNETRMFPYASFVGKLNLTPFAEQLADKMLVYIMGCDRLERLTLAGCRSITPQSLVQLGSCANLVSLDMSQVMETDDSVLMSLGKHCHALQSVNFVECHLITDAGVDALAKGCPSLRKVKLNDCSYITDEGMSRLVSNCPQLLELDLSNLHLLTDATVHLLFESSRHLRELRLNACTQLTDASFESATPRSFEQLRGLDLSMCKALTDQSVRSIIAACPRLRTLSLAKCVELTDASALTIATLGKSLHHLHMGHCDQLTDRAVQALSKTCTRLRYVDLACCTRLTDMAASDLSNLPKLKRVGLVKCVQLTDVGILALARMPYMMDVTDRDGNLGSMHDGHEEEGDVVLYDEAKEFATSAFAGSCASEDASTPTGSGSRIPRIEPEESSFHRRRQDRRWTTFFATSPLERVHLSYCMNISVTGIRHLLRACPRLNHLSLTGVQPFVTPAIQKFCRTPPRDYNQSQREVFCVFSGRGVKDLRSFLYEPPVRPSANLNRSNSNDVPDTSSFSQFATSPVASSSPAGTDPPTRINPTNRRRRQHWDRPENDFDDRDEEEEEDEDEDEDEDERSR